MIEQLRKNNPGLAFYEATDPEFHEFGRILTNIDGKELLEAAKTIPMPENGASYMASAPILESCSVRKTMADTVFAGMPIQVGYCWGYNRQMNAMEWHKSSEINVAVTPLVVILGRQQDIVNNRYDSGKAKAFLVRPGQVLETYATSLHYCPCQAVDSGFGWIVVLPKDTNTSLDCPADDPLITAKNKWLLAHMDQAALIAEGAYPGVYGENYIVKGV